MHNMKTKLFAAFAALVVLAACHKDPDENTDNNTTEDYQPTSAGSTWQYTSSTNGTYTETATGGDTTIGGRKFFSFDNTAMGRRYVYKSDGSYTSYGRIPQIDTTLELEYLRDAPVGTTWNKTAVYLSVPITLVYTVVSRDGEKTVSGTTFKNVIALSFVVAAPNPITGQNITIATGEQYYAKGVGAITSTFHLSAGQTIINDSTYLVSYNIK